MISSLHAYLPRNRRMIMWVSNNYYRYPIWTFCNWIPVNGYPCDLHVNYACFNGFLRNVSYSFQNCEKRCWRFYSKEVLKRHFLFQNLLQIWLISNNYWTSCGTISITNLILDLITLLRSFWEAHENDSHLVHVYHSVTTCPKGKL